VRVTKRERARACRAPLEPPLARRCPRASAERQPPLKKSSPPSSPNIHPSGIVLTNDGHAILREIDVSHPAAKSVMQLSRAQDEEVGDGTTSVVVLAGELLAAAELPLERGVHPTVIARAYSKALQDSLRVADALAFDIDTKDRGQMLRVLRSCLGTKYTSRFGPLMAELALDAVETVKQDVGGGEVVGVGGACAGPSVQTFFSFSP